MAGEAGAASAYSPAVFVHRRRNPSGFGFDLPHDIFGGLRAEAAGQAAYAAGGGLASGGESGSGHRATGIAWAPACKKAGGPISDWRRRAADRKSVVKGKRVSVSVDLGGRRMMKKKK